MSMCLKDMTQEYVRSKRGQAIRTPSDRQRTMTESSISSASVEVNIIYVCYDYNYK